MSARAVLVASGSLACFQGRSGPRQLTLPAATLVCSDLQPRAPTPKQRDISDRFDRGPHGVLRQQWAKFHPSCRHIRLGTIHLCTSMLSSRSLQSSLCPQVSELEEMTEALLLTFEARTELRSVAIPRGIIAAHPHQSSLGSASPGH